MYVGDLHNYEKIFDSPLARLVSVSVYHSLSLTLNFPCRQYAFGSDDSLWILEDQYVPRPSYTEDNFKCFYHSFNTFAILFLWY